MMAQGVVGTMMARAMPPNVLGEILSAWPVILIGVDSVVLTANVIGFATTALFLVLLLAARGLSDSDHVDGSGDDA